ncbi:serine/arginine repetitive matrix protein 1-like isoform X3 [Biomphalaria glabrata]|uniref:Serine/arginine repetitive matrix protein 1-like isoform X3 n=1 Tax=Biomphalaria glabrata TaxID=6526 RepID=A0A9W2ZKE4_BIOGL|nr:serine/arginine repetitive matrix protein 1-like isoform X3 [Biomphalaria glabrata]
MRNRTEVNAHIYAAVNKYKNKMASDQEDEDLEALRIAALATLKPKPIQQVITSISGVNRSSWNEFHADVVPEHQYIPEPLPEPALTMNMLGQNVHPWNNGIALGSEKPFRSGIPSERRPFHPRAHHRSFGDRGRPIHDRGRYPRRGYVSERGRGLFMSARGRGMGPKGHIEVESAGGNLIVINPKAEENNINVQTGNNLQLSNNVLHQTSKPKLILPQDKYHLTASLNEKGDSSNTNSPTTKGRDKFSRYNDSGSEDEDDDWLETSKDVDTHMMEEERDLETSATNADFEVEVRKLDFSDQEEEEKMKSLSDAPVASDDESIDLDVLASDDHLIGDEFSEDKNVVLLDEDKLSPEIDLDVLVDPPDESLKVADSATLSNSVNQCESVRKSLSSSSSSSSLESSSDSDSENEDGDKVEDAETDIKTISVGLSAPEVGLKISPPLEEDADSLDNLLMDISKQLGEDQPPTLHTTSSPHRSTIKTESPHRISPSPEQSVKSPVQTKPTLSSVDSQHKSSLSQHKSLEHKVAPAITSQSPRQRSISPRTKNLKYTGTHKGTVSPKQRSISPIQRSLSPRQRYISPRQRSVTPKPRSISPRHRSVTPLRKSISPRRRSISPCRSSSLIGRPVSPRRGSNSPRLSSISPRRRSISPRRRSISPRQRSFSPRRRAISPRRRSFSPRRRSFSPRRRSISPRRRSISPRRRSISPRRRSKTPKQRSFSPGRRSLSPRRRSITPKQRSISTKVRSFSPGNRSISPRRRSSSPKYCYSSKNRSHSPRGRALSPRQRSISPHPIWSKKRDDSPRKIAPPQRQHSPSPSHVASQKSITPSKKSLSPRRYTGSDREESRRSQRPKVYHGSGHNADYNGHRRDRYLLDRDRGTSNHISRSNIDSPGRQGDMSNLKPRDKKLEDIPAIDLEKLPPEERSRIEARMKKFCTNEVKIDPAKKVSLKSIKERPKKRKQSGDEDTEVKKPKNMNKKKPKSTFDLIIGEGKKGRSSDGKDLKTLAVLEDESDDSDTARSWRQEGNPTKRPARHSPFQMSSDLRTQKSGRGSQNLHSKHRAADIQRNDTIKGRYADRLDVSRISSSGKALFDEVEAKKKVSKVVSSTKSLVIQKPLRIEVQVIPKERTKKSKPDFTEVYNVPAKRLHNSDVKELSASSEKKVKKKKKDKKKSIVKNEPDPLPTSEETSDTVSAMLCQAQAPRPSVLDRLGKKVPLKVHKEKKKKKKKKKVLSDDEQNVKTSELDAKIQKIKAKNEAIARRQREIELDKEKYG